MKNFIWIVILLVSTTLFAQNQGSINGNVVDQEMNNEPLMFAQVEIQDTEWHTTTNLNGNFEIAGIIPGKYMMAISYSGYETREIPIEVKGNSTLSIHEGLFAKSLEIGILVKTIDTDVHTSASRVVSSEDILRK